MSLNANKPDFWSSVFLELNSRNFTAWDTKLKAKLRPVLGGLDALEPAQDDLPEDLAAVRPLVLSLLQMNLDEHHLLLARNATDPAELYALLKGEYRPDTEVCHYSAKLEFFNQRYEKFGKVTKFAKHLENEATELNSTRDPNYGPIVSLEDQILTLRASTKELFKPAWQQIDNWSEDERTWNKVVRKLQTYELEYLKNRQPRSFHNRVVSALPGGKLLPLCG